MIMDFLFEEVGGEERLDESLALSEGLGDALLF